MNFLNNSTTESSKVCSFQFSTKYNFGYKLIEKFYFQKGSPMVHMFDKIHEVEGEDEFKRINYHAPEFVLISKTHQLALKSA